ncbi:GNAT family N-acetyltransferase [Anaerolactibacter massiliensis]|uniref:GNAT family N-acetyltransferase n=1 Tax=Anaerolactibacter massiliensis TaxID=2044573 RepID=UPI000CFA39FC|nr:GNAT family N-acetyltransferase [Anaerolactibacter massiliensis]MDD6366238.1 GNAT family N-acetyltransferase [Stecheria intestinalis]MDY3235001.1 GNAT family N-acetyltransferase [Erysipelotrichaceae bacterium]
MTEFREGRIEDLEELYRFYEEVCAFQSRDQYGPSWTIGIYPSREGLAEHLQHHEMYLLIEEGRIASAMVLSDREDPEYLDACFPSHALADEVMVLHLFAVHPQFRGRHLSEFMLREMILLAEQKKKKAIHLDVLEGNDRAECLYEKMGFQIAEKRKVVYEDIGEQTAILMEYQLSESVLPE